MSDVVARFGLIWTRWRSFSHRGYFFNNFWIVCRWISIRARRSAALCRLAYGLLDLSGPYTVQFPVGAVFQQKDSQLLKRTTPILITICALQLWAQ